jgi:hypothetical protein
MFYGHARPLGFLSELWWALFKIYAPIEWGALIYINGPARVCVNQAYGLKQVNAFPKDEEQSH